VQAKNAEHEAEKLQEKERQEKAIGLLTYLGQGSVELEGKFAISVKIYAHPYFVRYNILYVHNNILLLCDI